MVEGSLQQFQYASVHTWLLLPTFPTTSQALRLQLTECQDMPPNKQQSCWYATLWLVVSTRHLQPRHPTDRHTYADGSADSANIASKNTCTPTNLPSTVCRVLVNHCHIVTLSISDRIGSSIASRDDLSPKSPTTLHSSHSFPLPSFY